MEMMAETSELLSPSGPSTWTKDWSILSVLTGNDPIRLSDELPVPKSSMVNRTPSRRSRSMFSPGRSRPVEDHPLGDLELQQRRVDGPSPPACGRCCRNRSGLDRSREARLTERRSGGQALVDPDPGLAAGLLEDPGVQRHDDVAPLGQGDERRGLERPERGMVPADERLHAGHLGGAQVDVGLVEHEELVVLEGVDQIGVEGALVDGLDGPRRCSTSRARVHLERVPAPGPWPGTWPRRRGSAAGRRCHRGRAPWRSRSTPRSPPPRRTPRRGRSSPPANAAPAGRWPAGRPGRAGGWRTRRRPPGPRCPVCGRCPPAAGSPGG